KKHDITGPIFHKNKQVCEYEVFKYNSIRSFYSSDIPHSYPNPTHTRAKTIHFSMWTDNEYLHHWYRQFSREQRQ
ncbi:TPA: hypothetical protein ACYENH_005733, partial [Klebsiella pneumoniae]